MQDLSIFTSSFSFKQKLARIIWNAVQASLFKFSPRPFFTWRNFLLKLFGADIAKGVRVYPSVKIFCPKNLDLGDYAIIGPYVDCYNVAQIHIGNHSMISQYSYLCSASHDHSQNNLPLISAPIHIGNGSWICADVFVSMGVTIGDNSLVAARSTVLENLPADKVCGGYPAKVIKERSFT